MQKNEVWNSDSDGNGRMRWSFRQIDLKAEGGAYKQKAVASCLRHTSTSFSSDRNMGTVAQRCGMHEHACVVPLDTTGFLLGRSSIWLLLINCTDGLCWNNQRHMSSQHDCLPHLLMRKQVDNSCFSPSCHYRIWSWAMIWSSSRRFRLTLKHPNASLSTDACVPVPATASGFNSIKPSYYCEHLLL